MSKTNMRARVTVKTNSTTGLFILTMNLLEKKNHVNDIESFWSYCKRRLAKFNGLTNEKFILHLKESEFRFNHRKQDLYKILLKKIRENPL